MSASASGTRIAPGFAYWPQAQGRGPAANLICYPSRAVGLILDLAVVVLAAIVIGSLALLAWTLAVSAVVATRQGRARIAQSRHAVANAEARLHATAERASTALAELTQRTARGDRLDR